MDLDPVLTRVPTSLPSRSPRFLRGSRGNGHALLACRIVCSLSFLLRPGQCPIALQKDTIRTRHLHVSSLCRLLTPPSFCSAFLSPIHSNCGVRGPDVDTQFTNGTIDLTIDDCSFTNFLCKKNGSGMFFLFLVMQTCEALPLSAFSDSTHVRVLLVGRALGPLLS